MMDWLDGIRVIIIFITKVMKSLSCLLRGQSAVEGSYRRTYGNANMTRRKDMRRLKRINIHNKQISGQSNPNSWFTGRRLKAMASVLQGARNNNEGSNPISPEMQAEILQKLAPVSDYQEIQAIEHNEQVDSCNIDEFVSLMPAKLRKDVESSTDNPAPELFEPLLKYIEQAQYYLPKDERERYNLLQKIQFPPKAKIDGDFE